MTQAADIRYFFQLDGERIPLANHMTVGRHLDNDVLLAGEDVLDYHLRIEMTDRGPRAIPLAEASLQVNGQDRAQPLGLMPGDRLSVGQSEMMVEAEVLDAPEADQWRLHGQGHDQLIGEPCSVGRDDDNTLALGDGHVSRHHARLVNHRGLVWLCDLGSSNGTFVNGERLAGACRLFHGDEVRFDTLVFQLIGRGADLTPVREADGGARPVPLPQSWRDRSGATSDTTEFAAVDELALAPVAAPVPPGEAGAFLIGASEPVSGMMFRTPIGRTLIGRQDDCDVVIRDRTVSARHAELIVRPEGVTITNMMSTNGTRVNGDQVQTARLHDGDVLRLGRVSLVFKDVPAGEDDRPWLRRAQLALLVGSLILALGLITFLL